MSDNRDKLIGVFIVALLVGTVGFMVYQESRIQTLQLQLDEEIRANAELEKNWGATYYLSVIRGGIVIWQASQHNLIPNAGRAALRGHIANSTLAVWNYIAIGTGSGGGVGSTTLTTEIFRALGTYALAGSYNFTLTKTWPASTFSGETVTEYGVFNNPTTGIMLSYQDGLSRTLEETDALQVIVNFYIGP